jgi:chromosomal replication initiation ATPase DnaA
VQAARNEVTNDDFFRALRDSNPFTKNRVSEVGDVESDDQNLLHVDAFKTLTERIERVRKNRASAGVMVLGAAGLGKSHLLAHMCQWARRDGRCTAVFLHNVLASPSRMARYLLRATVSALAGSRPEAYC